MWMWILTALAMAQDPASEATESAAEEAATEEVEELPVESPPSASDEPYIYEEIVVFGEQQVAAARDAVVRQMEASGWEMAKTRSDGSTVFRGKESWMGKAVLSRSGDLEFTKPVFAYSEVTNVGPEYNPFAVIEGTMNGTQYASVSTIAFPEKKKVSAVHAELLEKVYPSIEAYHDAIARRATSLYLQEIPDKLDELWLTGKPLDGGATLGSLSERKAYALNYWATRAETPEGYAVMRVVKQWLGATVQDSEAPVTREEALAAEAQRRDGQYLDLRYPSAP